MFNRTTLRVGVSSMINSLPYLGLKHDHKLKTTTVHGGIDVQIIELFGECFNLTIEWVLLPVKAGVETTNGTWNGLIGMILANQIDMASGGISQTASRQTVVDYLYPHDLDKFTFANTPAMHKNHHIALLIKPFDDYVWLTLLWSFMVFWLLNCLKNLLKIQDESTAPVWKNRRLIQNRKQHNLVLISICLLLKQPYHWIRTAPAPMKICAIFWAVATVALTNIYFGYMCSMLTLPENDEIQTIEELARASIRQEVIPLGVSNTSLVDSFGNSDIESMKIIWKHLQMVENRSLGIDMMLKAKTKQNGKRYAVMSPRERILFLQMIVGKNNLNLPSNVDKSSFFPLLVAIPIRKSSPFIKPFDIILSRATNAGLPLCWKNWEKLRIGYEKSMNIEAEFDDLGDPDESSESFNLDHLGYIFDIYWMSIILDITVFLVEVCHYFVGQNLKFSSTSLRKLTSRWPCLSVFGKQVDDSPKHKINKVCSIIGNIRPTMVMKIGIKDSILEQTVTMKKTLIKHKNKDEFDWH